MLTFASITGIHAQLNINVIARSNIKLPSGRTLDRFHRTARGIANYALVGCMDRHPIQAFVALYGYSVNQSPKRLVTYAVAIEMPDAGELMEASMHEKR